MYTFNYLRRITMVTNNLPASNEISDVSKEQLIADFKVVIADAEALIKATAAHGGEAFDSLRVKAEDSLAEAKAKIAETQDALLEKTRAAARVTDDYVHENPWQAVGAAAAVGLVIGLLIGRR
jgi:ElaB/YqjD/DUF883 family membrane-anchored ribosome-binding protein